MALFHGDCLSLWLGVWHEPHAGAIRYCLRGSLSGWISSSYGWWSIEIAPTASVFLASCGGVWYTVLWFASRLPRSLRLPTFRESTKPLYWRYVLFPICLRLLKPPGKCGRLVDHSPSNHYRLCLLESEVNSRSTNSRYTTHST